MENLLSKRFKHLGLIVIGLAILSMVFFYFLKYSSLNKEKIDHFVLNDIEGIEETLSQKYNQYKSRAKYIFSLFQTGKLS